MKKLVAIFVSAVVLVCACNTANAYIDRQNAVITILDKTAGKTHTMMVPVNRDTTYEKLHFVIRACKQTDPFQAENAFMFIEITTPNDGQIFGGWRNKNAPGENPLQNADFDMWLVRCE